MQEAQPEILCQCYKAAHRAAVTGKEETWTLDDTKRLMGLAPEVVWQDKSLWGEYAAEARKAFYDYYKETPLPPLRPFAKEMLYRLEEEGYSFYIVSMKTKELMLKEIGASGVAALARGYFGTAPGVKLTTKELLQQVLEVIGDGREAVVLADSEKYAQVARELEIGFIKASEEVFKTLK